MASELYHHGVPGMRWYHRRYQLPSGELTPLGRRHYGYSESSDKRSDGKSKMLNGETDPNYNRWNTDKYTVENNPNYKKKERDAKKQNIVDVEFGLAKTDGKTRDDSDRVTVESNPNYTKKAEKSKKQKPKKAKYTEVKDEAPESTEKKQPEQQAEKNGSAKGNDTKTTWSEFTSKYEDKSDAKREPDKKYASDKARNDRLAKWAFVPNNLKQASSVAKLGKEFSDNAYKLAKNVRANDASKYTNKELEDMTKRLDLERKYREAIVKSTYKSEAWVSNLLDSGASLLKVGADAASLYNELQKAGIYVNFNKQ